ncbi:hypothetical protein PRUPE_1G380000 [Prunus persica]|uniref:Uncharacterized protein n=1 Tax=Prunus persica TaxID=3760 RepID=A0A251R9J7_PRUPE|nr:hypothetical protein PRUPE_1G380000 [Prunus persica]
MLFVPNKLLSLETIINMPCLNEHLFLQKIYKRDKPSIILLGFDNLGVWLGRGGCYLFCGSISSLVRAPKLRGLGGWWFESTWIRYIQLTESIFNLFSCDFVICFVGVLPPLP